MNTRTAREPTAEELESAWRVLRRADWQDMHALSTAAQRYKLVYGYAQARARGDRPAAQQAVAALAAPAAAAVPAHRATPAAPHRPVPLPHHPPQFDHKRLASGERDDD